LGQGRRSGALGDSKGLAGRLCVSQLRCGQ
jgi:hypothetical protein